MHFGPLIAFEEKGKWMGKRRCSEKKRENQWKERRRQGTWEEEVNREAHQRIEEREVVNKTEERRGINCWAKVLILLASIIHLYLLDQLSHQSSSTFGFWRIGSLGSASGSDQICALFSTETEWGKENRQRKLFFSLLPFGSSSTNSH